MKKIYSIISTVLISAMALNSVAQQQPNNGTFEGWDNTGTSTEEPTNWNGMMTGSLCGLCGLGASQRVFREGTTFHGGMYSARIESTSAVGTIVNGAMTTGKVNAPSTTPSQGYNQTVTTDANFRHAFTQKPDSVVFFAKYNITNNADSARVSVVFHDSYDLRDPQDGNSVSHVVATARKNFQTAGTTNWKRVAVPVNYSGPATTAAYMLATFTSSYVPGSGSSTAKLWVDDLMLIYNVAASTDAEAWVTATNGWSLDVDYTTNGTPLSAVTFTAQLSDASGSFANPTTIGTSASTMNASGTINCSIPAGTAAGSGYKIRVVSSSSYYAGVSTNITIYNAAISIAPTATQMLLENEAGTMLTISGTAGSVGYEWLYGTQIGVYGAFAPAETGVSYTPQFAAAGTYYVIGSADYSQFWVNSAEVQVDVTTAVGVANGNEVSVPMYNYNGQFAVDLRNADIDAPVMSVYDLTGKLVMTRSLTSNSINQVEGLSGFYLVRITHTQGQVAAKVVLP